MKNRLRAESNMKNRCPTCGCFPCRCRKSEPVAGAKQMTDPEFEACKALLNMSGKLMRKFL